MSVVLYSDELMHYGVLGMKWGVRHDRKKSVGSKNTAKSKSKTVDDQMSELDKRQFSKKSGYRAKSPYFSEVEGAKKIFGIDDDGGKGGVFEQGQTAGSMGGRARQAVARALAKEKDGSKGTLYADARDWTVPVAWSKKGGKVSFSDPETGKSISESSLFSDKTVSSHSDWYYTTKSPEYRKQDTKQSGMLSQARRALRDFTRSMEIQLQVAHDQQLQQNQQTFQQQQQAFQQQQQAFQQQQWHSMGFPYY